MHHYPSIAMANAQIGKLRIVNARPAEGICAYLRGLRRLLTVAEVAEILRRHQETVYKLIGRKNLPASKHQHGWRIDPARLADWIEAQDSAAPAPAGSK